MLLLIMSLHYRIYFEQLTYVNIIKKITDRQSNGR